MHLDLYADDQKAEVDRLLELGATVHRAPNPGQDFVIMADPEGKLPRTCRRQRGRDRAADLPARHRVCAEHLNETRPACRSALGPIV